MDDKQLRITGWIAIALLILGQLLPWTFRGRPIGAIGDLLFSSVSKPNAEWWLWFLAPLIAIGLAVRGMTRLGKPPLLVIAPAAVFFLTWATLILTGVRRYTGFRRSGFLVTFIGILLLTVVAMLGHWRKTTARPRLRT